jgi:hypothetical protein
VSNAIARRTRVERGIYRRPDGRLEIGWREARGKLRWRVVDGGITAARAALATEHAKRTRGEAVAADPRLTFDAAAGAWWEARVTRLLPATQRAYGPALKHLRAHFRQQRIVSITTADVAAYVAVKNDYLKGWTVKGHLTVLSAVYRYANRHLGVAVPNPVSALDSVERPKTDDSKPKRILTPGELSQLIAAVSTPPSADLPACGRDGMPTCRGTWARVGRHRREGSDDHLPLPARSSRQACPAQDGSLTARVGDHTWAGWRVAQAQARVQEHVSRRSRVRPFEWSRSRPSQRRGSCAGASRWAGKTRGASSHFPRSTAHARERPHRGRLGCRVGIRATRTQRRGDDAAHLHPRVRRGQPQRRATGETRGALWKRYGNDRPQQSEAESRLSGDETPSLRAVGDTR